MESIIKLDCPVCNKNYEASVNRLKHGRQTTCSRSCSYTLRAKKTEKKIECKCGCCEKTFYKSPSQIKNKHKKIFCSTECKYKATSLKITPRIVETPYNIQRKTEEEKKIQQKQN
jgi:hypothetical protein